MGWQGNQWANVCQFHRITDALDWVMSSGWWCRTNQNLPAGKRRCNRKFWANWWTGRCVPKCCRWWKLERASENLMDPWSRRLLNPILYFTCWIITCHLFRTIDSDRRTGPSTCSTPRLFLPDVALGSPVCFILRLGVDPATGLFRRTF